MVMDQPERMSSAHIEAPVSEDDEEPILKYQRLTEVSDLLESTKVTSILVLNLYLVLGTEQGRVRVCTPEGKFLKEYHPHSRMVSDLA
eukprot:CAMPEP_0194741132 /NCGR_PEP_ID=MMETSP0296-20130528/95112_1 /TAXON_ID=39354 /ORGANISM="Heterosigma akashiwo, Strain CCMP2393" /LENGTH=87 /DNA_ID=CAMNT_0039652531 /DNA_START=1 /DNA_END=260 /DNA_ORIENTATION=+